MNIFQWNRKSICWCHRNWNGNISLKFFPDSKRTVKICGWSPKTFLWLCSEVGHRVCLSRRRSRVRAPSESLKTHTANLFIAMMNTISVYLGNIKCFWFLCLVYAKEAYEDKRRTHIPKIVGSNPTFGINRKCGFHFVSFHVRSWGLRPKKYSPIN